MDVVATEGVMGVGGWRFPDARAELVAGDWWVLLHGRGEHVLPAGVSADPQPAGVVSADKTTHDIYEDLRLTPTRPTPELRALHLQHHVQRWPAPDLCIHGRGMWHQGREDAPLSCRTPGPPGSGTAGVRVDDVVRMVNGLDALRETYEALTVQRRPVAERVVLDVLAWPGLPAGEASWVEAAWNVDGALPQPHGRRLFVRAVNFALAETGGRLQMGWEFNRRPEFRLETQSVVALYVADTLARLGLDDKRFRCSECGQHFVRRKSPRHGERLYCSEPECQRARARINQARSRARKAAGDGEHQ